MIQAKIPISQIQAGSNDRTTFEPVALEELARSIKEAGLLQPPTVRVTEPARWQLYTLVNHHLCADPDIDHAETRPDPHVHFTGTLDECEHRRLQSNFPDSMKTRVCRPPEYTIICGERRFRAVKLLGWEEIPVQIVDASDEEASAAMLTENLARADLDPIDEAQAYQKRVDLFGWTGQQIAEKVGVSVTRVYNRLKLTRLLPEIQTLVRSGSLGLSMACALAEASLDGNHQLFAIRALNHNPSPSAAWFRSVVCELAERQHQSMMFSGDDFMAAPVELTFSIQPADPPDPLKDAPRVPGGSLEETAAYLSQFWERTAAEWDLLGKGAKANQCKAASLALKHLHSTVSGSRLAVAV